MEGGGREGKGLTIALWQYGGTPPTPATAGPQEHTPPPPQGAPGAVASPTAGAVAVGSSPTF